MSKYNKEYYQKNKAKYREQAREYYQLHKEQVKAYSRARYRTLMDTVPGYKESVLASSRKSYLKNREKSLQWQKEHWLKMRLDLVQTLGGKCNRCDFPDYRALQVDHVFGGGVQELKLNKGFKSPRRYLLHILKNRERYQLLCANCNWIKRHERSEYAKKRKAA